MLLVGSRVEKRHTVRFNAGDELTLLILPAGDQYVLLTRDFDRSSGEFSLPSNWRLASYASPTVLSFEQPNPTLVNRADNHDSFQGPIPAQPVSLVNQQYFV